MHLYTWPLLIQRSCPWPFTCILAFVQFNTDASLRVKLGNILFKGRVQPGVHSRDSPPKNAGYSSVPSRPTFPIIEEQPKSILKKSILKNSNESQLYTAPAESQLYTAPVAGITTTFLVIQDIKHGLYIIHGQ